jgi:cell division inhibitor SulA
MPRFIIEREIPGAGNLSPADLQGISQKSCSVLRELGPQIQWVRSFVTQDKIYCEYLAPDEKLVREHARQGGFPANSVVRVVKVIDPTTAET